MSENQDIILLYKRLSSSQARLALATLISAKGSSYRRPGSRALIVDDGTSVGGLSAGCLEKDITCRLDSSTTEPFCLDYDLTAEQEDDPRGFPFGCGGQVIVLVEPLNDHASPVIPCPRLPGATISPRRVSSVQLQAPATIALSQAIEHAYQMEM